MEKFEPHLPGNWNTVLEQLLIGVSHHISNRVSTLAGVSDILSQEPSIPPILRALADEVPKLEEAIRLLRLLAAPEESEEPVEPLRLVEDAIRLAKLHPELRGVSYKVEAEEAPPVLTKPLELTHQIVVALVEAGNGEIPVRVRVDGDDVAVTVGSQTVRARTLVAARAG
jgi:signal transduction histidine kinase